MSNQPPDSPPDPNLDFTESRPGKPLASGFGADDGYATPIVDDGVHLMDYVRVLHKRRWIALTAFFLVVGLVTLTTFTATPLYDASVQILIEKENPNILKIEEVYDQDKAGMDYYPTQYRLLRSRLLARRTIEAEKLWDHPALTGAGGEPALDLNPTSWVGSAVAFVRGIFPREAAAPESPEAIETRAQAKVISAFLEGGECFARSQYAAR